MEDLMNTLILGAVVAAAFPIAFLAARLCLGALVLMFPMFPARTPWHK
jgi:hypothetical protein